MSASLAVAWMQTYSSALLAAAAVAALYGLVHASDMLRRNPLADQPAEAAEPAAGDQGDLLVYIDAVEDELLLDEAPEVADVAEEAEPEVSGPEQPPEPEAAEPEAAEPVTDDHSVEPASEEPEYAPVTPLFEPEPFVRKQRAAFGRKAG
jgi:hypothetical protein